MLHVTIRRSLCPPPSLQDTLQRFWAHYTGYSLQTPHRYPIVRTQGFIMQMYVDGSSHSSANERQREKEENHRLGGKVIPLTFQGRPPFKFETVGSISR